MLKIINGFWFRPKKWLKPCCALAILTLTGCFEKTTEIPLSGNVELRQTSFGALTGWQTDDFAQVIPVFAKNCQAIMKNTQPYIYNAQIKISTKEYQAVCRRFAEQNITSGKNMKTFIEQNFVPYAISDGGQSEGKFTSYYEAVIRASKTKHGAYQYPIYGKPNDLVEINLRDFDAELPNTRLVGRIENGKFIPYYNRRNIENAGIDAPVLMWGDDLVDIHFMQIQGSAVAQMDDGQEVRIGFADSNGRKFKGIGSILVEKGQIKREDSSMPKIREWLRANPQKAQDLMAENERFIFQRITNADGPIGAMGVSLSAGRSMAVDNRYIPLGAMMWLDSHNPDGGKIQKIVFAQDIGSAIKGVVRGDYFWGHGEEALYHAGRMNSVGKYYILAPKNATLKVN